jgi:hypothetical protein
MGSHASLDQEHQCHLLEEGEPVDADHDALDPVRTDDEGIEEHGSVADGQGHLEPAEVPERLSPGRQDLLRKRPEQLDPEAHEHEARQHALDPLRRLRPTLHREGDGPGDRGHEGGGCADGPRNLQRRGSRCRALQERHRDQAHRRNPGHEQQPASRRIGAQHCSA